MIKEVRSSRTSNEMKGVNVFMGKHNGYRVSIYCPVGDLLGIEDYDAFEKKFDWFAGHTGVEKVYLETYRGGKAITREQMEKAKAFFVSKGMETAGGITTVSPLEPNGGFTSFCYTDPRARALLKEIVEFTASLFGQSPRPQGARLVKTSP